MPPGRDRRDDGGDSAAKAEAVPAVQRVQVAGAAAERAGHRADSMRERHPDGADHADDPAGQDHERVSGGAGHVYADQSIAPAGGRDRPVRVTVPRPLRADEP